MIKVGEGFSFAEVFDLARRLEHMGRYDQKYKDAAAALRKLLPENWHPGELVRTPEGGDRGF